jgi:L-ascorbate metabolism protein UlaG (beta-lactamase superfamily)
MKLTKPTLVLFIFGLLLGCKNETKPDISKLEEPKLKEVKIIPINHATMILSYNESNIYVDPTGKASGLEMFGKADVILITDIHGDHYNLDTLKELDLKEALIVAPQAVIDKFPEDFKPKYKVLQNGESTIVKELSVEAIPMYNLRKEALQFHPKGRGNGYVITINGERIYISGDTEDISEMRGLKNIDKAFICMNLPYTMPVKNAADAVLDFKPKTVYPYHYRGTEGLSDVNLFKQMVNERNTSIEVQLLDWYK